MKYEILVKILDELLAEAPVKYSALYPRSVSDPEKINNARSRAFIHLYLKVLFGILDFDEREKCITDGAYDGGIDGYYINEGTKQIYLIQSKFRTTEKNFENKHIALEEVLTMDVTRVLEGEINDENGNPYNGKIKQLQREVSNLPDVARYNYKLVLLANLPSNVSPTRLRQLAGGYAIEVFDFEKTYEKLVFPVISGTYFTASDISIPIDLSNKNAGSKISYTVRTKFGDCEITALFVPTIEIAKIMNKYKNSILQYNPRSYLELEGQSVNRAIRETILSSETNEFALYNNGITMLSDETYINEKIGQKNKAQLTVKNPQIINGGQTSYTLSMIYETNRLYSPELIFKDKEVLLKIITLIDNKNNEDKLRLIDEISNATNKQTPVITADRFANEILHLKIQKVVFEKFGLLYERKRGEFADGLRNNYIRSEIVIERNMFLRLFYSANGMINKGYQKKLFQINYFPEIDLEDGHAFDRFFIGLHVFRQLVKDKHPNRRIGRDIYAKVYVYTQLYLSEGLHTDILMLEDNLKKLEEKWKEFIQHVKAKAKDDYRRYRYHDKNRETGEFKTDFSEVAYYRSVTLEKDIVKFFGTSDLIKDTA